MPIYKYHCPDRGRSFVSFVGPDRQETECPDCHGENIARDLSVFASARGPAGTMNGGNGGGAMGGGGCRAGAADSYPHLAARGRYRNGVKLRTTAA